MPVRVKRSPGSTQEKANKDDTKRKGEKKDKKENAK